MLRAPSIGELLERALSTPEGYLWILQATEYLVAELEKNRFNSERALEVYKMAVDKAYWLSIRNLASGSALHRDYRRSEQRNACAAQLVLQFTKDGFIRDQRPARRYLRWLLGA